MIDVMNACLAGHHNRVQEQKDYRDKVALLVLNKLVEGKFVNVTEARIMATIAYRIADAMSDARGNWEEEA